LLLSIPGNLKENEVGVACGTNDKRNAYRLLVGKPEGKKPLAIPRLRWADNMLTNLVEIGLGGVY
jgi:hypothetical protein